jgi:multicomponent Na+:H+ antiporter subunit F
MLSASLTISLVMLGVAQVLTLIRLLRGPALPDRVVALELFATLVVGMTAVYAIISGRPEVLRASMALALVSFLGAIAYAKYLERRAAP